MSWRFSFDSAGLCRTIAAGCVGRLCAIPCTPPNDATRRCRQATDEPGPPTLVSNLRCVQEMLHNFVSLYSVQPSRHVTNLEALSVSPSPSSAQRYDFVILGNGTTGRAALETLQEQCPGASIALVDPLRSPSKRHRRRFRRGVDYLPNTAVSLDPRQRTVGLLHPSSSTKTIPLQYKYGLLIATGAHGAPPPSYLMEDMALAKVWELRPTTLLHQENSSESNHNSTRSFLPPTQVRAHLVKSAQKGQAVGILGSSWDALDIAIAAAAVSGRGNRPLLLFGASGPLSQCLPTYLSTAVSKRLKQRRIHVQDRSLVRYINHDESTDGLQIYAARSYDFLESSRWQVDQVVIAPDTLGPRGNAIRPTLDVPDHLQESRDGRFWNVSWSQLSMTEPHGSSMIVCYKDDGRISVNSELCAATGVYAAGSVAKCGNSLTGHADVTGEGVHDGAQAGRVAALNMARHYHQDSLLAFADGPIPAVVRNPLPVWRSDVLSYDNRASALPSIGIHCLCVGTCDSERYATHGVWWTNQAAQQRILRLLNQDEAVYGDASSDISPEQSKRRRKRMKESNKAVYGLGIIYYLDRTGRIQGIMTWGLPFTRGPRRRHHNADSSGEEQEEKVNPALLERMQQVIVSNGGMNSLESEFDQMRMSKYLAEESRVLVGLALATTSPKSGGRKATNSHAALGIAAVHESHQLQGVAIGDFPRPLHRYTDPKPAGVRSHGVLKRRDGHGQGLLGEDLFSRYQRIVPDPSPPKPATEGGVGYAAQDGATAASAWHWYDFQVYEQREQRWMENDSLARPPKEDRIWIRKGDETRHVSAADNRAAVMDAVVGVHRAR